MIKLCCILLHVAKEREYFKPSGGKLYHGTGLSPAKFKEFLDIGVFVSFTTNRRVAKNFAANQGGGNIVCIDPSRLEEFCDHNDFGADISWLSYGKFLS